MSADVTHLGALLCILVMATTAPTTRPDGLPAFDRLWKYDDPAATEQKFREILPRAETSSDRAYLAELLTQVARAQGRQGHFADAHGTLDRVEPLLAPDVPRPRVRYLLERGRVFNSAGRPADALPLFRSAADLADRAGERSLHVDALHMVAIAVPTPAEQIEANVRALNAVGEDPQLQGWRFSLYNNLAEAYASAGRHEEALATFRKLSDWQTSRGEQPWIYTTKDIARMLRLLGRVDEALATIRPVYDQLESKAAPDGYIDEELAECLLAKGQTDRAVPLFARAYREQSKDPQVAKHDADRLARLKRLGGT